MTSHAVAAIKTLLPHWYYLTTIQYLMCYRHLRLPSARNPYLLTFKLSFLCSVRAQLMATRNDLEQILWSLLCFAYTVNGQLMKEVDFVVALKKTSQT